MNIKIGIAIAGFFVVAGGVYFTFFGEESEEVEFFTSEITRGTIQNTVSATGTVEPVVSVQVGSQVSGQIQTLYADFNTIVTAGQILAKLDPRTFESQLENAEANLVSARARVRTSAADLTNTKASMESSRASLRVVEVDAEKTEILFRRSEEMKAEDLISQTDYESARATAEVASARVEQSRASIKQAEAQIISREAGLEQARAQVIQAEADVNRANINLEYTNIYSPVDGVVISREVDVGQTVAASMSAPTLFMIANDLTLMRVNASVDEADIGKLSQSNRVNFTVDAFPGEAFQGFIEEMRLNPKTSQNVVTYSVIIGVNNQGLKLKPGMTANITVTVDRKDNVLTVPNAALRYTPPEVDLNNLRVKESGSNSDENSDARGQRRMSAQIREQNDEEFFSGRRGGVRDALQRRQRGGGARGQSGSRLSGRGDEPNSKFDRQESQPAAPGQLWDSGQKIQFRDAPQLPPREGSVWVLNVLGLPEMRDVILGITDGARSEVLVSDLQIEDRIIIGDSFQGDSIQTQQSFNPFMRFSGRGRR